MSNAEQWLSEYVVALSGWDRYLDCVYHTSIKLSVVHAFVQKL